MLVVVGPVSADSAKAWLGHARGVLDELRCEAHGPCPAGPDMLQIFADYLTRWEWVAAREEPFCWQCDISVEQAVYHMHAFHQVADMRAMRAEWPGEPLAPAEGSEFAVALLTGVLNALEAESSSSAAFAQHLGQFWPGRDLSLR